MTDRDALAREMFETVCDLQLGNPLVDLGQRLRITDTCADIALRHIAAARAEALEEISIICASKRGEQFDYFDEGYNAALDDVEKTIRALMEPPE